MQQYENIQTQIYICNLIKQFIKANNLEKVDIYSPEFRTDFTNWVISRQKIGEQYFSMLNWMKTFLIPCANIAEVGKGKCDSLVLNSEIPLITPYSEGLGSLADGGFIEADFAVYQGIPMFVKRNNDRESFVPVLFYGPIRRFITHNPYDAECISNWSDLNNGGLNAITVGIYGSTTDKDMNDKFAQMEALKEKLTLGSYREEYTTIDDSYFYVVSSNEFPKKLKKRRICD